VGSIIGFYLAASLPVLLTAALLFLTPMSFLVSTARNSSTLVNQLALGLGLVVGPLLAYFAVGLDLMWTGIIAGSAAYALNRLRETLR
jgi:4-hydroxybenzoate polyprenyltransferase